MTEKTDEFHTSRKSKAGSATRHEEACSQAEKPEFFRRLNDPLLTIKNKVESFREKRNGCFVLCNAGTKASDHEGISAAGATPAARRLTPALDAEALVLGKTVSSSGLPVSPLGIVSPVVITRACLTLLNLPVKVVDCGSFHKPAVDSIRLSELVAECPSSGKAMSAEHARMLFSEGVRLGNQIAETNDYAVIAECVPGGTTTAMAVLTALGYDVRGLVSSSLPNCNHEQRWQLVKRGISASGYRIEELRREALLAVACLGDPMQAVAAGIAASAARKISVFLAGGSQMLAVWALLKTLSKNDLLRAGLAKERQDEHETAISRNVVVITTGWVADDPAAGVRRMAQLLQAPLAAACPDFYQSRHSGLNAYEDGNVKEGVGAGAVMGLSYIKGFSPELIMQAVDDCYDELINFAGQKSL